MKPSVTMTMWRIALGRLLPQEHLVPYEDVVGPDVGWLVLVFLHPLLGRLVFGPGIDDVCPLLCWVRPKIWNDGADLPAKQYLCWNVACGWMGCGAETPEMPVKVQDGVPVLCEASVPNLLEVLHESLHGAVGFWIFCCNSGPVSDPHLLEVYLEGVAWLCVEGGGHYP